MIIHPLRPPFTSLKKDFKTEASKALPFFRFFHRPQPFKELQQFRIQEKWLKSDQSYHFQKARKEILIYRTIFFSLSFVYLLLCYLLSVSIPNGIFLLFFEKMALTQQIVTVLSLAIAVGCSILGFIIRCSDEVLSRITLTSKNRLKRLYLTRQREAQKRREKDPFFREIDFLYEEMNHKIDLSKRETEETVKIISTSTANQNSKKKLTHQALLEYEYNLERIVSRFKKISEN